MDSYTKTRLSFIFLSSHLLILWPLVWNLICPNDHFSLLSWFNVNKNFDCQFKLHQTNKSEVDVCCLIVQSVRSIITFKIQSIKWDVGYICHRDYNQTKHITQRLLWSVGYMAVLQKTSRRNKLFPCIIFCTENVHIKTLESDNTFSFHWKLICILNDNYNFQRLVVRTQYKRLFQGDTMIFELSVVSPSIGQ